MGRQRITKPSKLARIIQRVGQPIAFAAVRGGANHRIDVFMPDGSVTWIWPDDTVQTNQSRWRDPEPPTK